MADETWSAKVSPEIKEEISQLIKESGIFALAAYLIVIGRRFLKRKAMNDKELLQKMDELIPMTKKWAKVVIAGCCILILCVWASPYKWTTGLPKISVSEIDRVTASVSYGSGDKNVLENNPLNLYNLVTWYNHSKELKTDVGTTSDAAIHIYLKDKSIINICTMYSKEMVAISHEKNDGRSYYQTNASSKDLATLIKGIRKEAGLD